MLLVVGRGHQRAFLAVQGFYESARFGALHCLAIRACSVWFDCFNRSSLRRKLFATSTQNSGAWRGVFSCFLTSDPVPWFSAEGEVRFATSFHGTCPMISGGVLGHRRGFCRYGFRPWRRAGTGCADRSLVCSCSSAPTTLKTCQSYIVAVRATLARPVARSGTVEQRSSRYLRKVAWLHCSVSQASSCCLHLLAEHPAHIRQLQMLVVTMWLRRLGARLQIVHDSVRFRMQLHTAAKLT